MVGAYMEKLISPLLDPVFLVKAISVDMLVEDVHHLSKIASLPTNTRVESMEDLALLPSSLSLLPLEGIPRGVKTVSCLEMQDATCIPRQLGSDTDCEHSTITMEIKPKQGFYQDHPGVELPYCNNCILQVEKCKAAAFEKMYDFCPLALFSMEESRQLAALEALIEEPHRNLRLFLDGRVVLDDEMKRGRDELQKVLFPTGEATVSDMLEAIVHLLSGCSSSPSLLKQLLHAQQLDNIGLVRGRELFSSLSAKEQEEVVMKREQSRDFMHLNSPVALLKKMFLAATFKDCSVMISVRLVSDNEEKNGDSPDFLVLPNGLSFAFSAKVVDLDPKAPKNLFSASRRLLEGAKILRENPSLLRKPCVSL